MSRHTAYLLAGDDVTVVKLFDLVERFSFDVIHYAAHAENGEIVLSREERLSRRDCAQVSRTAKAKINVFSSCHTGSLASYVTGRGVPYAFFAHKDVDDLEAMKFALTLYNELENSSVGTVLEAFRIANDGDGTFGWTMDIELALQLLCAPEDRLQNPLNLKTWQLAMLISIGAISLLLSVIALLR